MQNSAIDMWNNQYKDHLQLKPEQLDLQWDDYIDCEQWSNSSLQVPSLSPDLDADFVLGGREMYWGGNDKEIANLGALKKPSYTNNINMAKPKQEPHRRSPSMSALLAVKPITKMKQQAHEKRTLAPATHKMQRDLNAYTMNPPINPHSRSNSLVQCATPRRSESPEFAEQSRILRAPTQSPHLGAPVALSSDQTLETRNVNAKARFTLSDDVLVLKLRNEHGLSWQKISEFFVGRSAKSLQVHYSVGLKNQNRAWLPEEDEMLRKLYAEHERAMWDVIAKRMGSNVSAVGCMSRFDFLTRLKNRELEDTISRVQKNP